MFPLPSYISAIDLELYIAHPDASHSENQLHSTTKANDTSFSACSDVIDDEEFDVPDPETLERPKVPLFGERNFDDWLDDMKCEDEESRNELYDQDLWLDDAPIIDDEDFCDLVEHSRQHADLPNTHGYHMSKLDHSDMLQRGMLGEVSVEAHSSSSSSSSDATILSTEWTDDGNSSDGSFTPAVILNERASAKSLILQGTTEWQKEYDSIMKKLGLEFYCPQPNWLRMYPSSILSVRKNNENSRTQSSGSTSGIKRRKTATPLRMHVLCQKLVNRAAVNINSEATVIVLKGAELRSIESIYNLDNLL